MKNQKRVVCYICKREFKGLIGLGVHISTMHRMSPEKYYILYLRKEKDEGVCRYCNINKTSFLDMRRGFYLFCSKSCAQSSVDIKNKKEKTCLKNYGVTNYTKTNEFKENHNFGYNNRKKAKQTILKKYGVDNISKVEKIKDKKKRTCLKNYGVNHYSKTKERIDIMKTHQAGYMNSFIKNPSKPQVELFKLCQEILPYPIMNYPCLNYSIDITVPSLSLAIEYDGSHWHQDKEYDKNRQKKLEDEGWKFLRYIDYVPPKEELTNDVEKVISY
jgi:hypothetical protein